MSNSRKIVVMSNANGGREVLEASSFSNWGELKDHLIGKDMWNSTLQAVVKGTRVTLSDDKAELPVGDFTLFLVPTKMKSGKDNLSDLSKEDLSVVYNVIIDTLTTSNTFVRATKKKDQKSDLRNLNSTIYANKVQAAIDHLEKIKQVQKMTYDLESKIINTIILTGCCSEDSDIQESIAEYNDIVKSLDNN